MYHMCVICFYLSISSISNQTWLARCIFPCQRNGDRLAPADKWPICLEFCSEKVVCGVGRCFAIKQKWICSRVDSEVKCFLLIKLDGDQKSGIKV
jgi:hypothetical protein